MTGRAEGARPRTELPGEMGGRRIGPDAPDGEAAFFLAWIWHDRLVGGLFCFHVFRQAVRAALVCARIGTGLPDRGTERS